MRMAQIYDGLDDAGKAEQLRREAEDLYRRFNERFWMEDEGCYALGLDADKRQIDAVASNAGHCLWAGIVPPERARRLAGRLFRPDMWCGWGIRTLSAKNPAYNPYSYQRGSVWPHDNGIIAAGLKRYGFADEANRIAEGIFAAATYFNSYRLPEVFSGLARRPGTFPAQYIGANIPQAWAAGSIIHLLQTMLGLRADAPNRVLYANPTLPPWLPDLALEGLRVGGSVVDLRFWREGDVSYFESRHVQGKKIKVELERTEPPVPDTSLLLSAGGIETAGDSEAER
jgi:glycogen debranching enzyme